MSRQQLVVADEAPRALVVDDEEHIRHLLAALLEVEGYRPLIAADGEEALRTALDDPPDLILLDISMPGLSGTEVLRRLRQEYRTRHVPIILITARDSAADRILHFRAGADDYITKPFDVAELLARSRAAIERSEQLRGLNPITRLPGNADIAGEIERRLRKGDEFSCLYADLDGFKGYNDHYGFARGDGVIKLFGESIIAALDAAGVRDGFVGHIGGDDFIALVPQALAEKVAAEITGRFDGAVPFLYDDADRKRGRLEITDRLGQQREVPFVSVSIGIVPAAPWRFATAVEVGRSAAEVKEAAKREPGSAWVVDRRGR